MEEGLLNIEKDPGKVQFQQELNKLFESRGIIADMRSHLRHLMITALQSTRTGLKPTDRSSPKAQALNLLVAEYLFRHKCHYTLSVFTSEVPTLASFNPELVLQGGNPSEASKRRFRANCFQVRIQNLEEENEVEEIFNALGMSSHEEELAFLKSSYLEKGSHTSLFELFIQTVVEMSIKLHIRQNLKSYEVEGERLLSKQWSKKIVDILLSEKMSPPQVTALEEVIFRLTENEMRRAIEQEQKLQMQMLSEREKRIQEYLKKHEDDILFRLVEAERELKKRRDMIDEELTEREKHLTEMAVEWKNKHEEILKLSKNFYNIERENEDLQRKLKALEEENANLKTQEKSQSRTIDDLREEMNLLMNKLKEVTDSNAILSERVQVLISRENKEVFGHHETANQKEAKTSVDEIPLLWSRNTTSDCDVNFNRHNKESSPKIKSKGFTIKSQTLPHPERWNITETDATNMGSGEAERSKLISNFDSPEEQDASLSSSSEEIILGVRKKLQDLEEETNRINQNYFEYKLKCAPVESDSESWKNPLDKSSGSSHNEIVTRETKFSQTNIEDAFAKARKLKETKQTRAEFVCPVKKKPEASPGRAVVRAPTKRQLQNRDFFLKTRHLLQALENRKIETPRSSSSGSCSSTSSSFEDLSKVSKKFKNKSPVKSVLLTPPPHSTEAPEVRNTSAENAKKTESLCHTLRDDIDCLALLEEARIKSPEGSARKPLRQRILVSESEKEETEEKNEEKIINCADSMAASCKSTPSEKVSVGG